MPDENSMEISDEMENEIYLNADLNELIGQIKQKKFKLIGLQLPEGWKTRMGEISKQIEAETSAKVVVFLDPCFGACDLKDREAKELGCDALIHLGHSDFQVNAKLETIYVPLHYAISEKVLKPLFENVLKEIKKEKLGKVAVVGTAQFLKFVPKLETFLEKNKIKIVRGKNGPRTISMQVLGCNYFGLKSIEKEMDGVVYLGDGHFHPLGIAYQFDVPVINCNPLTSEVKTWKGLKEKYLRNRFGLIAMAKKATRFGLLVSTKPGQMQLNQALQAKKMIESDGKEAFVLATENIKPELLMGLKLDCLVNTACPRIAVDDFKAYKIPLLNFNELMIVLGKASGENLGIQTI